MTGQILYVDGGFTQMRMDQVNLSTVTLPVTPIGYSPAQTYNGWFLGSGTDMSLSNWLPAGFFLRTEYRWSGFSANDVAGFAPGGAPTGVAENTKPYVQTITTSLVYHFNWR